MEIVIGITWIGTVIMCYYLGTCIDKLESTVNKQQEQIDFKQKQIEILGKSIIELGWQDIKLSQLCSHMNQASMDIATKVVSIEERIDKQ